MASKKPTQLDGFAHTWVGGDIHGLSALAGTLYGYLPKIDEAVTFLNNSVSKVAHDAGWSGDAAGAFQQAWGTDALAAQALQSVISATGDALDTLAVQLAAIESALEDGADHARTQGVAIGADGQPPAAAPSVGPPSSPPPANPAAAQAASDYATLWTQSLQVAEQARVDAATTLKGIYDQVAPPKTGTDSALATGDKGTVGDYLRGLWAVPSAYSKTVGEQAEKLRGDAAAAQAAWTAAKNARPNPNIPMPKDVKDNLHDTRLKLADVETKLTAAEALESKTVLSSKLDTRLTTALSLIGVEARTSAELGAFQKTEKFIGDVPFLDAIAAVDGTYFMARDDIQKGQPWYEAVPEDALANVGSLAVGAVAGTLAAGAADAIGTGLGFAGAGVIGVASGAVIGGVVCVGVGDLTSNLFHEHWDEDMHKDGFWGGLGDGIGHSVSKTGSDMADLASKTGSTVENLGKKAWHGIFG
ncbi:uncharacterized protein YukE [Kitasatospora sp. MAA4]|uniref:WXG100 family type VII secretion target n=1 Tax=Kitasatospora sp. MAA4 TaxID=3035093 RepID=UPI0024743443|nr:hypothetical protein [Kitasatospora sp. MAA4]MDH6132814.1 uncharacterized protein YukE [Kitasatospora sp. MAA4]